MPEVTVRDARPRDAAALAEVWAAAVPYLVRSEARAAQDLGQDEANGRHRWVAEIDHAVVGTAVARVHDDAARIGVEVHPDFGSRRVGTALLHAVLTDLPDVAEAFAVCNGDPISLAFAVRHNFVPVGEHQVARVDPREVAAPGSEPDGLVARTLDQVDLDRLLDTYNLAADDDPSGLSPVYDSDTFRADWWDLTDNAPDLSWALVDTSRDHEVVAAFTSLQVDRPRRRAWTSMTATHPAYRGRGLATWVKRRSMVGLAQAKVKEAWTANDATNGPMLAVNRALGYVPAGRSVRVSRRVRA